MSGTVSSVLALLTMPSSLTMRTLDSSTSWGGSVSTDVVPLVTGEIVSSSMTSGVGVSGVGVGVSGVGTRSNCMDCSFTDDVRAVAVELVVANEERESLSNEWVDPESSLGSSGRQDNSSAGTDLS